ncbi:MAG: NAD-dependent deacylase [Anaerolineaceae bacterium]|nr:NAD-dependent deacylase [Anaerolineaceae bacterium]
MNIKKLDIAAELILSARRVTAFTGAGISVESGIPPFRGEGGLWNKYDPHSLDISFFYSNPEQSWDVINQIFYEYFGKSKPNGAHLFLAELEALGFLKTVITQNIDNLHQIAGNTDVVEFHGNSYQLTCLSCNKKVAFSKELLNTLPPKCAFCDSVLKPDFIFFGEAIPPKAYERSIQVTRESDVWLIIGTTGEVYPASSIPTEAKRAGSKIIEINLSPSSFTYSITDIFLKGKATEICNALLKRIKPCSNN